MAVGRALAALVRVDAAGVRYVYWRALLALCLVLPWLPVRRSRRWCRSAGTVPVTLVLGRSAPRARRQRVCQPPPPIGSRCLGWVLVAGVVFRVCSGRPRPVAASATEASGDHRAAVPRPRGVAGARSSESGDSLCLERPAGDVRLPASGRSASRDAPQRSPRTIQQVVLCHELFHVRRRDWIWVVAEEIVKAVLWFHPAMLWLISRVRLAREEVVDELTVLATVAAPCLYRSVAGVRRYAEPGAGRSIRAPAASVQADGADFEGDGHVVEANTRVGCDHDGGYRRGGVVCGVCVSPDRDRDRAGTRGQAQGQGPPQACRRRSGRGEAVRSSGRRSPSRRKTPFRGERSRWRRRTPLTTQWRRGRWMRIVVDRQGRIAEVRKTGGGARGGPTGRGNAGRRAPPVVAPPSEAFREGRDRCGADSGNTILQPTARSHST